MVGASGGEFGIRGFIAAFDLETGKEQWRTYTIPAPGEPGSETWPKGDQWKTGGGSVWVRGNYDPATNTAYWGTGNGGPWMGDQRPGDNLYIASTLALDVATGKIKGHFQYTPNESFDWDEVSPPLVVDYRRNGQMVKGLIDVARNGYIYFLDRGDGGAIKFVDGSRTCCRRCSRASTRRPAVRISIPSTSRAPAMRTCRSARRSPAAGTGLRSRSIRRRACSTFRRTTTCARH
jgi:alcohol dehydrogenase (cytochrome c)